MADFSGHGVAAALNAFRLHAYLEQPSATASRPGDYLTEINEKLLLLALKGQFATLFYGVVDSSSSQLLYAAAACPHPLLLRAGGQVERLDGTGLPLGIQLNGYPARKTPFQAGDTLLVYSDALIETPDARGKFLSEDNLADLLRRHAGLPVSGIKENLLAHLKAHAAAPLRDDLTLMLYRRLA
jgi:sigma-B regulation protein RsbU (phosphoserine phosphatase)